MVFNLLNYLFDEIIEFWWVSVEKYQDVKRQCQKIC